MIEKEQKKLEVGEQVEEVKVPLTEEEAQRLKDKGEIGDDDDNAVK